MSHHRNQNGTSNDLDVDKEKPFKSRYVDDEAFRENQTTSGLIGDYYNLYNISKQRMICGQN